MKLALMQPYLFPYIGYYQLIKAVDVFVCYDDVQFIKNGWINRNRILVNGSPKYITLPVERGHLSDQIKERRFVQREEGVSKILRQIDAAYWRAPFYKEAKQTVEKLLSINESLVSKYLLEQIKMTAKELGINTDILLSSEIFGKDRSLAGQAQVLELCTALSATVYINAIGGMKLYQPEAFRTRGIDLRFVQTRPQKYLQFGGEFHPNLSLVDVMMLYERSRIEQMLDEFDCVCPGAIEPSCVLK